MPDPGGIPLEGETGAPSLLVCRFPGGCRLAPAVIVAIHQPNFLPWLGYFDKIARADVFVFMDNVQFPKKGGTWMNRVRILVGGQPAWITIPVVRSYNGTRSVAEMEIDSSRPWRDKLLTTIRTSYARAPYVQEAYSLVQRVINFPAERLSDYNVAGVSIIAEALGFETDKLVLGTALNAAGTATELLIAMVRAAGGDRYLSGGGAAGYQEDEKFAASGVELVYQRFQHPPYQQGKVKPFVPGLSVLDALMWCGVRGTAGLLAESSSGAAPRPRFA